jgi:centrin-1
MYMLTPPHALLDGAPKAFDEEGPTVALLAAHCDAPPYESLTPSTDASKHERLFWRGRDGPGHLLFLLRFQMLWTAICLAVCYTWMTSRPEDTPFLLLGFLPVFDVLLVAPKRIMPMLTVVTSIEMMKKAGDIKETVDELKIEKTLKMLKMLQTLRGQAKRAARLAAADKQKRPGAPKPKPKEIDPVQEEELREAFDLFDKDGSGRMDTAELGDCLKSLGVELDETALNALAAQMDTSGDGTIDFEEFKEAMASSVDEKETSGQIASSIFQMLDSDGSGKITSQELKDMVKTVNPDLTDDDVAAAMTLFDTDNSGQITEKEFRQALEKMKTFDQA